MYVVSALTRKGIPEGTRLSSRALSHRYGRNNLFVLQNLRLTVTGGEPELIRRVFKR